MTTGLKKQWGLKDAQGPPSTAQADEFKASYQGILSPINAALQYTVVNAEKPKHLEKTKKRDALNVTYQATLRKINPRDPSKAEGAIKSTLATAHATSQDICSFKEKVEKDVAAWQAKEPEFQKAISQIEELEAWGDKEAPVLRKQVKTIQDHVNAKRFVTAVSDTDALIRILQPVYDNYLKQKAAKEKYDPALEALKPDLTKAAEFKFKKLEDAQKDIGARRLEMESYAKEKEYVTALEKEGMLDAAVKAYLTKLDEIEKKKAAYEAALAPAQDDLKKAAESKAKAADLETIQADVKKQQTDLDTKVKEEEFEEAQKLLPNLQSKVKELFTAIEKKKTEFETSQKALQPKVDDCLVSARDFPAIKKQRQEIITFQEAFETAGKAESYDDAKDIGADLEKKITAYLEAAKKAQEKYDQLGDKIKSQLDGASDATRGDVAKAAAKALKPDEVKYLPTAIRNRLLEELQKGGLTDDEKKACKILFSQPYLDPEFEKLDMQHRREMIEKMKADPEFKRARENWNTLTEAERIAVMQKAVDYQADAYGIPKTTIETYKNNDKTDYGFYRHSDGKLHVNAHDAALKRGGFDEAIDTAVHENGHRMQSTMIDNLSPPPTPPKIKPGDPEYNQAMTFKLNDTTRGYYIQPVPDGKRPTPDTGDEYFTQPQENHSRITGRAVKNAKLGK